MTLDLSALDVTFQATGVDGVLAAFQAVDAAGEATAAKEAGTIPFTTPGAAEAAAAVSNATQLLDAMGISARSVATGVAAVAVADRDLTNAQNILAKSGLEVEAVSKAEAIALREQAVAARAAAAAMVEAQRASNAFHAAPAVTFRGGEPPRAAPPIGAFHSGGGGEEPPEEPPLEPPGPSPEEEAGIAETTSLYGGLAAQLVELIAVYEAYRAVRDAIVAGGQFDASIESARLGIAAITQAYGTLTDAQGNVLTGQNALTAAFGIADQQLQGLQADAVRVAIPFAQLADLFRGIEGAALKTGASLDQIRQLVTSASLAATALGTPYEQLNTTLVQLLEGHVRVTNQLVAHLGLSNQIVHEWQQQETLIPNLLATFDKFNVVGEQVQGTWRGISAEIKNAFDILTGTAIRPALTILEQGLRDALGQVLNLNTGALSDSISGLVTMMRDGLAGAAHLVVDGIQAAVRAAQELSTWFEANRDRVEAIAHDALSVVESIGSILADAIKLAAAFEEWYQSSLLAEAAWRGIADAVGFVADHAGAFAALAAGIAGIRLVLLPLAAEMTAAGVAGAGLVGVLGTLLSPVTLVIAALSGLAIAIEAVNTANDAAVRRQTEARETAIAQAKSAAELTGEYRQLAQVISSGTLTDAQKKDAQEQLKTVTQELIKLSPDYQSAVSAERGTILDQANAVAELTQRRLDDLIAQRDAAKATVDEITAREASLKATLDALGAEGADEDAFKGTQQELDRTTAELDAATKAYYALAQGVDAAQRAQNAPVNVFTPNKPPPGDRGKEAVAQAEAAAQIIGAAVDTEKAKLKAALDANQLSYKQYFEALTAAEIAALDAQIRAKQAALAAADKPEDKAKAQAEIAKLEEQEQAVRIKNADELAAKLHENADKILADEEKVRAAQGETYSAALANIGKLVQAHDAEMEKAGASDAERRASDARMYDVLVAQLDVKTQAQQIEQGIVQLTRERATLEEDVRSGTLGELEAERQLAALEAARLPTLQNLVQVGLDAAKALGDPALVTRMEQLQAELTKMTAQGTALGRLAQEFQRVMGEILASGTATANAVAKKLADMFAGHDLTQAMVDYAQRLEQAARDVELQFETLGENLGKAIADGLVKGVGTKGGTVLDNVGKAIVAGIGGVFEQVGEALIQYGVIMTALLPALENIFTSGPAALVAGAALATLGAAMAAAFGGGSGSHATAVGAPQTINIALPGGVTGGTLPGAVPPAPTPGSKPVPILPSGSLAGLGSFSPQPQVALPASSALGAGGPPVTVNVFLVGEKLDPYTQRVLTQNVRAGMKRGY